MALLTIQSVTLAGLAPTYAAAAAGGDTVDASSNAFLHVKNGGAGAVTVTIATPGDVGGLAIADAAISVPAAGERMIGPLHRNLFGSLAAVTYSAVTSVTVAAIQV